MQRINYGTVIPGAAKALRGVHDYLHTQTALARSLIELVFLRASQINGCAFCIDTHSRDLLKEGFSVNKLMLVSVWREAEALFDERERAALAWTEVVTEVAETQVPDEAYAAALSVFTEKELADLTVTIALINAYNRIGVAFRLTPPSVKGAA